MAGKHFWGWLPHMTNFASKNRKWSRASIDVAKQKSIIQPANADSTRSIFHTVLAVLSASMVVSGPVSAQDDASPDETQEITGTVFLASGTYQGVWRDEDGKSGEAITVLDINGESIKGKLTVSGVSKYSGDRISGKTETNDDGTLSLEFKTRDGKWKSKAVFDGQLLVGTFYYEFQDRRVQKIVKGEWAAQQVAD